MRREFSVLAEGRHTWNCAGKVPGTRGIVTGTSVYAFHQHLVYSCNVTFRHKESAWPRMPNLRQLNTDGNTCSSLFVLLLFFFFTWYEYNYKFIWQQFIIITCAFMIKRSRKMKQCNPLTASRWVPWRKRAEHFDKTGNWTKLNTRKEKVKTN